MPYIIIGGSVILVLAMWLIYIWHMLGMLNENINNAMSQIGVQISSRWDVLSVLMDMMKGYDENEYKMLAETLKARRIVTAESSPLEAAEQENLLVGATSLVMAAAEQHPTLKANKRYRNTMDSMNQCEGMARQSRLFYNDSVTKLNRHLRVFPISAIAWMIGFDQQAYLEARADQESIYVMMEPNQ